MSKTQHDLARIYNHEELTYTAYKRCRCGAGLAYPASVKDPYYYWGCGYIMTHDIKFRPLNHPTGPFDAGIIEDEEGVRHDCAFSFVFHEFMKENSEVTTRPLNTLEPVKVRRKTKNGK